MNEYHLFLDLKKAFDTVSHSIMLRKLSAIGVSASSVKWFDSYFSDRTQLTRVSGKSSSEKPIRIGVPQGSILGPILFQIYVNDLPGYIAKSSVSMFADDTAIYSSAETHEELELILQDDLHSVSQWLHYNRLTINASKTKVMKIGTTHKLRSMPELNLHINNTRLGNVSEFLYLGVLIDSGLRMSAHVDMTHDKCVSKLGLISKTRYLFDMKMAKMLYISTVLPIFDYCGSVFMVAPAKDLERLQRLQKVALRIILKADYRTSIYVLHALATRRE